MSNSIPPKSWSNISRRSVLALGGAAVTSLAMPAIVRAGSPRELTMLTWSGHAAPDVVGDFEQRHNVKIRAKEYVGGDQMLALISQSPPGTYDVILADAEYVAQLKEADYIEHLDPRDYPFDDFFPEFQNFRGHWFGSELYAVFVRFGFLGISHHLDSVSRRDARSYRILWDRGLKGKVGQFDWHLPNLGTISLMNGNPHPFDLDDSTWRKVTDVLSTLRPQVRAFYDYGGVLAALKGGEAVAVPGIGDWITGVLERDGANVTTTIPEEGGLQWTESLSIGKGSRRQDLARDFIRYMLSPEGQVRTATMRAYPAMVPTRAGWAKLNADQPGEAKRQNMLLTGPSALDEIRSGRIRLRELPARQALEDWNEAWSRYKSQRV
jgi:spermidine/putrescine transport system substrate-binding protein